jgi:hypothetical protein
MKTDNKELNEILRQQKEEAKEIAEQNIVHRIIRALSFLILFPTCYFVCSMKPGSNDDIFYFGLCLVGYSLLHIIDQLIFLRIYKKLGKKV